MTLGAHREPESLIAQQRSEPPALMVYLGCWRRHIRTRRRACGAVRMLLQERGSLLSVAAGLACFGFGARADRLRGSGWSGRGARLPLDLALHANATGKLFLAVRVDWQLLVAVPASWGFVELIHGVIWGDLTSGILNGCLASTLSSKRPVRSSDTRHASRSFRALSAADHAARMCLH